MSDLMQLAQTTSSQGTQLPTDPAAATSAKHHQLTQHDRFLRFFSQLAFTGHPGCETPGITPARYLLDTEAWVLYDTLDYASPQTLHHLEKCLSYPDLLERCPDRSDGNWFLEWAASKHGRKEYPKVVGVQTQGCKISVQKG